MDYSKADVLADVCVALADGDSVSATEELWDATQNSVSR